MATTMTLAQLRTAAQQRADMVNSTFVTDAEWTSYLQQSIYELYDLMVAADADRYSSTTTISTDGTSDTYALPSDFLRLRGVDLVVSAQPNGSVTILPFNFGERNRYTYPNVQALAWATNLRYRLLGSTIEFVPRAAAGQTIKVWYIPRITVPTAESDTFDGISGWTEYVIIDAAIKALQKEESDVSILMAQKQAMRARIEAASDNRDVGNPPTVTDAYATGGLPGLGPGWPFGV